MSAKILDGKAIAYEERQKIAAQIKQRIAQGKSVPGLAVILVGNDPASHVYVQNKQRACEEVGFYSERYDYPSHTTTQTLLAKITELNQAPRIHGILVQLPLPSQIAQEKVLTHIAPHKDVDGFHVQNLGKLAQNQAGLRPCTPSGIMTLLFHTDIVLKGTHACMIGASRIVGRPMALELLNHNATVTICHQYTQQLAHHITQADLVIVAIGQANFIQGSWIKAGAVVIDVGINRLGAKLTGDVDFQQAKKRASWITPVPGGVGPMTICALLKNTLHAAENTFND